MRTRSFFDVCPPGVCGGCHTIMSRTRFTTTLLLLLGLYNALFATFPTTTTTTILRAQWNQSQEETAFAFHHTRRCHFDQLFPIRKTVGRNLNYDPMKTKLWHGRKNLTRDENKKDYPCSSHHGNGGGFGNLSATPNMFVEERTRIGKWGERQPSPWLGENVEKRTKMKMVNQPLPWHHSRGYWGLRIRTATVFQLDCPGGFGWVGRHADKFASLRLWRWRLGKI